MRKAWTIEKGQTTGDCLWWELYMHLDPWWFILWLLANLIILSQIYFIIWYYHKHMLGCLLNSIWEYFIRKQAHFYSMHISSRISLFTNISFFPLHISILHRRNFFPDILKRSEIWKLLWKTFACYWPTALAIEIKLHWNRDTCRSIYCLHNVNCNYNFLHTHFW